MILNTAAQFLSSSMIVFVAMAAFTTAFGVYFKNRASSKEKERKEQHGKLRKEIYEREIYEKFHDVYDFVETLKNQLKLEARDILFSTLPGLASGQHQRRKSDKFVSLEKAFSEVFEIKSFPVKLRKMCSRLGDCMIVLTLTLFVAIMISVGSNISIISGYELTTMWSLWILIFFYIVYKFGSLLMIFKKNRRNFENIITKYRIDEV